MRTPLRFITALLNIALSATLSYAQRGASSRTTSQVPNTVPFGYLEVAGNFVDGSAKVSQGAVLQLSGWAADQEDGSPVTRVQVLMDGIAIGDATVGLSRPDVAGVFDDSRFASSGWSFTYSLGSVSLGVHTLTALAYDSQGATGQLASYASAGAINVTNRPPFGYVERLVNASDGTTVIPQNATLAIDGWAADNEDGSAIAHVQIAIDGIAVGDAITGLSRPDVASVLGNPLYANSGWSFTYNVGKLSPGQHAVSAVAFDSSGASTQLTNLIGAALVTVPANTPPLGYVEQISNAGFGGNVVPQGTVISIGGWAADNEDGAPITRVQVFIDGIAVGDATVGFPRADVATVFQRPEFTPSGWNLDYNVASLAPGRHTVSAIAYDSQRATTQLTTLNATGVFTVVNDQPILASIVPNVAFAGAASTSVGITGSGFASASQVISNGQPLSTRYIDEQHLAVEIPASLLNNPATLSLQVSNAPIGGQASSSASFAVIPSGTVVDTGNPQVASYTFQVPEGCHLQVQFGLDTTYPLLTSQLAAPSNGGPVRVLVAGMKGFSTYHMRGVLTLVDGSQIYDSDHVYQTGGLDSTQVPVVNVVHNAPEKENPGIELMSWVNPVGLQRPTLAALDRDGKVIWYYADSITNQYMPVKLSATGTILAGIDGLKELNLAGEALQLITLAQVQTALAKAGYSLPLNQLHHDFQELPNGHFLLLGNTVRNIVLSDSSQQQMLGDVLIEIDRSSKVYWVWNSFDHLDPNRHPVDIYDWTHSNAVVYLPQDGNLLLSMRHQSWILKIDYQNGVGTGQVVWRLGYQGDFGLAGNSPIDWFYLQHYPSVLSSSNGALSIAVFDNGNNRILDAQGDICGSSGQIPCYSRGVIMDIDENSRTAAIRWQSNLGLFSFWGGSIQQLANSNVEVGITTTSFGSAVREISQDSAAQTIWEMEIGQQNSYRAVRIPSLYPGVNWP